MLYAMADNGINIPADRDGALYNFFTGNQDYIFQGIGDEFAITTSATSFIVRLTEGEGVICGRHVTEKTENGANSTIQLNANASGYVTIRIDLARPSGTECYLCDTPTLVSQNLNNTGTVRDLPLYSYATDDNGVSAWTDMRRVASGQNVINYYENGKCYVQYYENNVLKTKQIGSLDPSALTARPTDVKQGKIFGGFGSDDPQVGTFAAQTKTVSPSTSAQTIVPDGGKYLSQVTVNPVRYLTQQITVNIPGQFQRKQYTFTFSGTNKIFGISKFKKISGGNVVTIFTGYPDPFPASGGNNENSLNIPSTDIAATGNTITQIFLNNSDASNVSAVFEMTVACV